MELFIGTGRQFLNEHLHLECANPQYWARIEKLNSNLMYFRIEHLFAEEPIFFILYRDKEILAIIKTQKSSMQEQNYPWQGVNYISVKDRYQGTGLAKQLCEAMFSYFSGGFILGTDFETVTSQARLEKMSYRLAKENKVFFLTRQALLKYYKELPKTCDELYTKEEYR